MVVFPPDAATRHSGGLVRQRYLLLELESGAVYHLSVPYSWGPLPDRVAMLAEAIRMHDHACPHQEHIASVVAWKLETQLTLVDLDLSAPTTAAWPVRAAALQSCYVDSFSNESSAQFAERMTLAETAIAAAAITDLRNFVGSLDPDIVCLSSLWGCLPCPRYNWLAHHREDIRTYRIQAARVFPALVPVLSGEFGPVGAGAQTLSDVIDRGEPLVDALAKTYVVRAVTARHALTMPPALMAGEKLATLMRALDRLIPERFPRNLDEWTVFDRLVHDAIPKLTDRPAASPDNLSFLPGISRQGWTQAENRWSRLCVGDGAAALIAEFLAVYRKALTWEVVRQARVSQTAAQDACKTALDDALTKVGLFNLFETSSSFQTTMREARHQARAKAKAELDQRLAVLRRGPWSNVLKQPATFADCKFEPLLTTSALVQIGNELGNCLDEHYAHECVEAKAHIFSIRSTMGVLLGALHLRFQVGRHGGFEVQIRDCKGPRNVKICALGKRAVAAFCDWLKTPDAQRRISELPRMRLTLSTVEVGERYEMESTIAALRHLRQKSFRFDVLRKKILDMLGITTIQNEIPSIPQPCPAPEMPQPLSQFDV